MAYTTVDKQTAHFNTKLYTGNASTNAITGVGHRPDFVWIKNRSTTGNQTWFNALSGVTKYISSNTNYAEASSAPTLTSFDSDGFTVGSSTDLNGSGNNICSWNWKAANSSGTANTDGSINSTVSANTAAGFSIVKHTGTGSTGTIGHGLGVAPKVIISKNLSDAASWGYYHFGMHPTDPADYYMSINSSGGRNDNANFYNDTEPTSSVFSVGSSNNVNDSSDDMIHFCFAEKPGFSKFGSYVGTGNSDLFIYTGFKPSWLMIKLEGTENWHIFDVKRNPTYPTSSSYDGMATRLMANLNNSTDLSQGGFRFLSNGLKMTTNWSGGNGSGSTFIYMCFGQTIVGSNNVPCTAR
jgi:hypothetical protein